MLAEFAYCCNTWREPSVISFETIYRGASFVIGPSSRNSFYRPLDEEFSGAFIAVHFVLPCPFHEAK